MKMDENGLFVDKLAVCYGKLPVDDVALISMLIFHRL